MEERLWCCIRFPAVVDQGGLFGSSVLCLPVGVFTCDGCCWWHSGEMCGQGTCVGARLANTSCLVFLLVAGIRMGVQAW